MHRGSTRLLDDRDLAAVHGLLDADPISNVFVASRVEAAGVDPRWLGAELWGYPGPGGVGALCYAGANLVPICGSPAALRGFAERARRQGRRCSSLFGRAEPVLALWELLRDSWGPAREVREEQPLLALDTDPSCPSEPRVRRVRPEELEVLLPASIAMFTEEVGISPVDGDGGALYRARVAELVRAGRAFAWIEDGQVLFKAELGAVSRRACQIQGVWVRPDMRGRGLGAAGTASVVHACLKEVAPVASLYVNAFNGAARAAYARVGFRQTGTFASVLF